MGQKVNPHGVRVGIIKDWDTKWYAEDKDFPTFLKEDYEIRKYIKEDYYADIKTKEIKKDFKDKLAKGEVTGTVADAIKKEATLKRKDTFILGISKITIERAANRVTVTVFTSKPGIVIGKSGTGIDEMKKALTKITKGKQVSVNVKEVKKPDCDAQLIAESIAAQLEKRASFRRTMKQAISKSMRLGVKGVKVMIGGRLDGAEIARSEQYHEGSIPLQTLRADIDYGFAQALTTFGILGVKVWVYKGEILGKTVKTEGEDA